MIIYQWAINNDQLIKTNHQLLIVNGFRFPVESGMTNRAFGNNHRITLIVISTKHPLCHSHESGNLNFSTQDKLEFLL